MGIEEKGTLAIFANGRIIGEITNGQVFVFVEPEKEEING